MKAKHRTGLLLPNWSKDNYFHKQTEVCDKVLQGKDPNFKDNMDRIHADKVTVEEFIERFEKPGRPVIIQGISSKWPGKESWKINQLVERFGESNFKVGESDSGRKLKVTLNEYIEYVLYNRDDSPLYLFESSLEDHPQAKVMQDDYKKPKYFEKDHFVNLLGESRAPPHRWFLIGPKRSGSEIHQDPLGTSAWNTSITGHKRWLIIKPGTGITKKLVRGNKYRRQGEDDEAI